MSDTLYKSPVDAMIKSMVENDVPAYFYVLNSTINALNYPFWTRVPHNIEYYFLTGAPFMDPGTFHHYFSNLPSLIRTHLYLDFFPEDIRIERKQWIEEDRRMSEFFMKSLANFARYGYCL